MQVQSPVTVPGLYVPTQSASFEFRGALVIWRTTDVIHESDPILRGRSHMVKPLELRYPGTFGKSQGKKPVAAAA